jgi:RNA polymerase sigma-70 factor (ECF subfamily)
MTHPVEKIWFQFGRQLSEYICVKTGHLDHCHDILQDVYVKIMQNIDKVEKADNINAYLLRLAGNAVNDHYRVARHQPTAFALAPTDSVEEDGTCCTNAIGVSRDPALSTPAHFPEPAHQLADCCLRPMIDSLPPIYRDALIWTQLEGMSQKQLAQKLGISETGARSRVQRAREKLKEVLVSCCNYQFDRYGNVVSCCEKPVK